MSDISQLPDTLGKALSEKGYAQLTPVQEAVTEPELAGQDLLVSAQTGSGKTVGFGLAIAADILNDAGKFERAAAPLALVIAPTRELAMQVRREFDWLFAQAGIVTASTVGGMDARAERRALDKGAHVIVATPGRLRDHIDRGALDLSALKAVVLDEADEMLDMGFSEDLELILDHTPEDRRTLMFSATVPRGIAKLAQKYQRSDAHRIEVGTKGEQHADITYRALIVAPSDIERAIINVLRFHDAQTSIIFANTRAMVARLTAKFSNRGFSVVSLSGELSQNERTHALQALRDGRAKVCIATDVAARGIDLPNLELVIHADLPSNAEGLLHRSGRTGRAGRKGTSVLIVPSRQRAKAERLLRFGKLDAEWGTPPSAEDVTARDEDRLLNDPSWDVPLTGDETAFAAKLLDTRSPEQIAAAFLRLHQTRNSAPEVLGTVPEQNERAKREPRAPREHRDFGPSTWFSLSLGRKQRAEPRWILPMLCRNAGISKDDIGAIRVQYQETFVEVRTPAVAAMKAELGEAMDIEQGARLTELDGMPDMDGSPKGPSADGPAPRAPLKPRREDHKPRSKPAPREKDDAPKSGKSAKWDKPAATSKPKAKHSRDDKPAKTRDKPRSSKPEQTRDPEVVTAPSKRRKGASDPSKPMGARKAKAKGKGGSATPPPRVKSRAGKGPDARPMRKPNRKS